MARMTNPLRPGMFYDVGGAAALYWPDQHPCGKEPADQRWLVFEPWGGVEIIVGRLPREDFTGAEIGMAPFITKTEPMLVAIARCQTSCDDGCGARCHESHEVLTRRHHDVAECEAGQRRWAELVAERDALQAKLAGLAEEMDRRGRDRDEVGAEDGDKDDTCAEEGLDCHTVSAVATWHRAARLVRKSMGDAPAQ